MPICIPDVDCGVRAGVHKKGLPGFEGDYLAAAIREFKIQGVVGKDINDVVGMSMHFGFLSRFELDVEDAHTLIFHTILYTSPATMAGSAHMVCFISDNMSFSPLQAFAGLREAAATLARIQVEAVPFSDFGIIH